MPPQEVTSDIAPLIQKTNSEEAVTTDEVIDDPNVPHGLVHDFVEFGDKLIEAEVDTGDVQTKFSWKKLWKYTGPGFLMSVAYLDPGNLEADLQSGAAAGYSLLWILLYAHIAGLLIQILSARCGVVTGKHLAQLIRIYYSTPISIILWLFTEIAIIGSDIQEIVGTAIAIKILFGLPLWIGTMLTAMDTFIFMLLQNYGVRKLEAFFMTLIAFMAVCFWVEMFQSEPNIGEIFKGMLIPAVPPSAVVQAVAMIGAVIMPHNLYLHSALVMTRKTDPSSKAKLKEANFYFSIESALALCCSYLINMAIVVVFARVFYIPGKLIALPGLYDAADVLTKTLGRGARYLWALGLLSAGQSSTMTGTLAGQYVVEGYFGKIFSKSWHRVAITRGIALIPSMFVAVFAVGHFDTMGELLNVLQSLCLPCALIPILKLTSSKEVMGHTFRSHHIWKYITWGLAFIIIGFNLFLFIAYLEELPNLYVGYVCGVIYFAFVLYLAILPLGEKQELEIDEMDGYKVITNRLEIVQ
ncbi:11845_t:CDS:2 [Funneliformis geosporum]|uniref:9980_t:CDS:1 n=1 Tax=Funneliformis geosporum TaxID=1117311 RepID=A0A9W4SXT3_9GLOM|nr:11845_t:CDS:2 [Funneliformis geosporum]CAI2183002.1 9980_t:CDS:2 [Funneliformis geosporum]